MTDISFVGKSRVRNHHRSGVPFRELVSIPEKSLSKKPSLQDNLIIHGDNLHALKALLPHYAGKVKCIYIDPPYNTGNEGWCYNDKVNSPKIREWIKKSVNPVDGEDMLRHDKWLCMMYPRLQLLRDLLSDNGVIFISIDDNEQHRLRLIMDEIFGERNFVANTIWRKKAGGGEDSTYFSKEHEHIICYRKTEEFKMNFRINDIKEETFNKLKNERKAKFIKLEKWGSNSYKTDRPTMFYPIKNPDGKDFYPKAPDGKDGNWRTRPLALDKYHIHWGKEKKTSKWIPYEVKYLDEMSKDKIIKDRTIFYDLATTTDATEEQKEIFGEKKFDNCKPSLLPYRLIQIATDKNSVVLDSFAGSGTTAHAVLALNKEDGGNRKFILVECEDYADKITAERVRRVIKGVPAAKEENLKNGLGGTFTYCELGDEFDIEGMLSGEKLPSYESLARYIFKNCTGEVLNGDVENSKNFFVGQTGQYEVYLIYEDNLEFLRSNYSGITHQNLTTITKTKSGKTKLIFATALFVDPDKLKKEKMEFCSLPYSIHKIAG